MFETSALDNSHWIDRKGQGPDRQRKLFQITPQQEPDQLLHCTWPLPLHPAFPLTELAPQDGHSHLLIVLSLMLVRMMLKF